MDEIKLNRDTQSYTIDMTPIAEQTIRGAAAALAEWSEPRLFLMAMEKVKQLEPDWWQATKDLPMQHALLLLQTSYELPERFMRSWQDMLAMQADANAIRERAGNEKLARPADADLPAGQGSTDVPPAKI